jgi:hypothetical protein
MQEQPDPQAVADVLAVLRVQRDRRTFERQGLGDAERVQEVIREARRRAL